MEDLHIDDRSDMGVTSTSSDDFENAGREPMHPRESVIDREPLRESQMTVPETPSPDMLAGKGGGRRRDFLSGRNADNPSPTKARGRPQRNAAAANVFGDQVKSSYGTICGAAEKMFNRIRQGVTCHAAPSSLKSAFLEPLSSKLASQISIDLLACTDDEFMAMFTGKLGMHPPHCCHATHSAVHVCTTQCSLSGCSQINVCVHFMYAVSRNHICACSCGSCCCAGGPSRCSSTQSRRPCQMQKRVSGAGQMPLNYLA